MEPYAKGVCKNVPKDFPLGEGAFWLFDQLLLLKGSPKKHCTNALAPTFGHLSCNFKHIGGVALFLVLSPFLVFPTGRKTDVDLTNFMELYMKSAIGV